MEWKSIFILLILLNRDIIDILDDKYDELISVLENTQFRDKSDVVKYHCDSIIKLINNYTRNRLNI